MIEMTQKMVDCLAEMDEAQKVRMFYELAKYISSGPEEDLTPEQSKLVQDIKTVMDDFHSVPTVDENGDVIDVMSVREWRKKYKAGELTEKEMSDTWLLHACDEKDLPEYMAEIAPILNGLKNKFFLDCFTPKFVQREYEQDEGVGEKVHVKSADIYLHPLLDKIKDAPAFTFILTIAHYDRKTAYIMGVKENADVTRGLLHMGNRKDFLAAVNSFSITPSKEN